MNQPSQLSQPKESELRYYLTNAERENAFRYIQQGEPLHEFDITNHSLRGNFRSVLSHLAAYLIGMNTAFHGRPTRQKTWARVMSESGIKLTLNDALQIVAGVQLGTLVLRKRLGNTNYLTNRARRSDRHAPRVTEPHWKPDWVQVAM